MVRWLKRKLPVYFLFLFFVCCINYSNSLHNDFMIDDYGLILQDKKAHNLENLLYQFIPDNQKYLNIGRKEGGAYYRPFAHIIPLLSYLAFKENVFGYHCVNLVLFFLCVVLIYYLIQILSKRQDLAMMVSLLYAAHPLNGLFVNYSALCQ